MKKNKKETEFDLDLFIKKSKADKKNYILNKSKTIKKPKNLKENFTIHTKIRKY